MAADIGIKAFSANGSLACVTCASDQTRLEADFINDALCVRDINIAIAQLDPRVGRRW